MGQPSWQLIELRGTIATEGATKNEVGGNIRNRFPLSYGSPPFPQEVSSNFFNRSLMKLPWVVPPPSNCGKWRFRLGSPTKNVIILVVTVTGRGDNPKATLHSPLSHYWLFRAESWWGPVWIEPTWSGAESAGFLVVGQWLKKMRQKFPGWFSWPLDSKEITHLAKVFWTVFVALRYLFWQFTPFFYSSILLL